LSEGKSPKARIGNLEKEKGWLIKSEEFFPKEKNLLFYVTNQSSQKISQLEKKISSEK